MFCILCKRRKNKYSRTNYTYLLDSDDMEDVGFDELEEKCCSRRCKILLIAGFGILIILVFVLVFVVIPLIFMNSTFVQQSLIFTHYYADSSPGSLSETAVVNDCVQLYYWVKNRTLSPIYVWGHSLGSALATRTVASLENSGIHTYGLVLESAFTNLRDELYVHPFGKIFAWLPWFSATILEPLERNGFIFNTSSNILEVTCPIMILHAQDDPEVPCEFGRQLYEIASKRSPKANSTTVYHEFDADLDYDHIYIYQDPFLKYYIMDFMAIAANQSTLL
nr:monoacylglycerol lipase ABHD12-like isoform X2 [Leptinotarsa decemlineata]